MLRADRDRVRSRLALASPTQLRAALAAVLAVDAEAQKGCTDQPSDEHLGWFADGVDTAAYRAAVELGVTRDD